MLSSIINIGIDDTVDSKYDIKVKKLFNGITFFGFFTGLVQIIFIAPHDFYATLFHSIWTLYCLLALLVHRWGFLKLSKISLVTIVIIFGSLASARIGSEYYPHVGSFGIMGATFLFFDAKKEWGYLLFFVLLHAAGMVLVESNILQNHNIVLENPAFMKTSTIIGTALFIALEIMTVLRLNWETEKEFVSELKSSNKELRQINDEKNVMLQEIHHRVKNNLQMVISLIRLQSNKIEDEKTVAIFKELKMRLISIARMHEMMYLSEKINKINFKQYVQELCDMILSTSDTTQEVTLSVQTKVDHLSAEGIVPLALILNELVTNSIKHAFDGTVQDNLIEVSFKKTDEHQYRLEYADNGTWKPPQKENGFGLELIEMLTEQLEGKVERSSSKEGTRFVFDLVI